VHIPCSAGSSTASGVFWNGRDSRTKQEVLENGLFFTFDRQQDAPTWFHPHRTADCHRHHFDPDRHRATELPGSPAEGQGVRVQAEEASLAVALESYASDHREYPFDGSRGAGSVGSPYPVGNFALRWGNRISPGQQITTPVQYIVRIPTDIFNTNGFKDGYSWQPGEEAEVSVFYLCRKYNLLPGHEEVWFADPSLPFYTRRRPSPWILYSIGPSLNYGWLGENTACYVIPYSPTNGTRSQGGIWRMP
jgi:hypothetical protein